MKYPISPSPSFVRLDTAVPCHLVLAINSSAELTYVTSVFISEYHLRLDYKKNSGLHRFTADPPRFPLHFLSVSPCS